MIDVLALPPVERAIFLYIGRNGAHPPAALVEALRQSPETIEKALAHLVEQGRLRYLEDGRVEILLGRVRRHTTLPPQLWTALLSPQRVYSEQEIAMKPTGRSSPNLWQ